MSPARRLVVEADGGSRGNPGPAGYGAVVRDADTGEVLAEVAAGIGVASNNVAEYRGLIAGLTAAAALDPAAVEVRMDSKLVVEQMAGRWQVKHPDMRTLRREAQQVLDRLSAVTFRHVPRAENAYADRLANEAMDAAALGAEWRAGATAAATPAKPNRLSGWAAAAHPPTVTLLLRHGETPLSVEKRFSGRSDPDLTDLGRAQAEAAAARLAARPGVAAVVSSPLRRTLATAEPVAAALRLPVTVDERLRETDFGDWEGFTFAEIQRDWPRELARWLADHRTPPPNGESFADTYERVRAARDDLTATYPDATLVVVSHVTPIKSLLRAALDAPPGVLYRLHLDPASLCEVEWYDDAPDVVRSVNDVAHLAGVGVAEAEAEPAAPL